MYIEITQFIITKTVLDAHMHVFSFTGHMSSLTVDTPSYAQRLHKINMGYLYSLSCVKALCFL